MVDPVCSGGRSSGKKGRLRAWKTARRFRPYGDMYDGDGKVGTRSDMKRKKRERHTAAPSFRMHGAPVSSFSHKETDYYNIPLTGPTVVCD